MTLSPLEPFILNDIEDTFTFVGSCSATGVPRPYITWSFTNRENVTMVLSPEFLQINISTVVMNYTVTSVITLANTTIAEREGTITCNASNAVTSVSAMQMPYIAGKGSKGGYTYIYIYTTFSIFLFLLCIYFTSF